MTPSPDTANARIARFRAKHHPYWSDSRWNGRLLRRIQLWLTR